LLTDAEAKRKMLKIAEDYEDVGDTGLTTATPFVSDDQELAALA
jgi:hypothetical protein